ncbi:MAG: TlyA family RNA methyltransferase [Desulfotomaculum sp.]|nr:TlyA family RNA methyltransferase [Desulfotomaculum sp.]
MSDKERLDVLLVSRNFFDSREKARAAIMAGVVFVDGVLKHKPGIKVKKTAKIEVKANPLPYVSRGGLKLEKAIQAFGIDLKGKIVLDVGASTGGFTDCALKHGARKVYAVDVGYGQLAWQLRQDPRVVVFERTNIRHLTLKQLKKYQDFEIPNFATIDVSFISLAKVMPKVYELTEENAKGVALIKPQFEAGPDKVKKKGVVRDVNVHKEVIKSVVKASLALCIEPLMLDYSPIKGPEGNIEYLLYFTKRQEDPKADILEKIDEVVKTAHEEL